MKKVLLMLFVFLVPFSVFATVDENTSTTVWEVAQDNASAMWCKGEEDNNDYSELSNASSGYYLYCIRISCVNGVNVHTIENPIASRLRCANGSTNPYIVISGSGAFSPELKEGGACSANDVYAYATEKAFYDCSKSGNTDSNSLVGEYYTDNTNASSKSSSGVFKIILISCVVLFVIGILGYFIYKKFKVNNQS